MKRILILSLAAVAVSVPSSAQKPASVVPVILYSYGYVPNPIVLAAGEPVTLAFTNRSKSGHEFKAPHFFAASKITQGSAPGGAVELKGGASASVTLFPTRGSYRVHCGHFLHTQFGMETRIIVR
ncbi:MAG: cupredoxin domain-containing protein [Alphaproteobacteria bacterium]